MTNFFKENRKMNTIIYMTSLLTFFIKGEIKSEQNFIMFNAPYMILGLVPAGNKSELLPINHIASISTRYGVNIMKLILGIEAYAMALIMEHESVFGAPLFALLSIFLFIDAIKFSLVVITSAGQQKSIDFVLFERKKAKLAEQQINDMVAGRLTDTNVREQTDRVIDAINRK